MLSVKQILRQCFLCSKSTFIKDIVSQHISQKYNLSTKIFVQKVPVERCPLGHDSYPPSRIIGIFSRMWGGHGLSDCDPSWDFGMIQYENKIL